MLFAFSLLAFVIVVLLVVLAVELIAALVRAVLVAAVALAAALGVGLFTAIILSLMTTGTADISGLGTASSVIIFIAAIVVIIAWRRPRRQVFEKHSTIITVKPTGVTETQIAVPSGKRGKPHDPAVAKAFATLKACMIGRTVELESVEQRYQAFLAMADRFPADREADTIARKICLGVPEYIEMFWRETEAASDPERHASLAVLIDTLETIAAEAERHRARLQVESDNRLKLQAGSLKHGIERKPFSTLI
jgi:hypothetical protein